MTDTTIVDSIIPKLLLEHMETLAVGSPPLEIAMPGRREDPKDGRAYLEVTYLPNSTLDIGLSSEASARFLGLLQVTVVDPSGTGILSPHQVAALVLEHFPKGLTLYDDAGVKLRIPSRGSIAPGIQSAGDFRIPVSIPYQVFA